MEWCRARRQARPLHSPAPDWTHQLGTKENQLGTKGILAEHFFEFATQLPPVGPKIGVGYVGYV